MNREQAFFFQILKDHLNGVKRDLPEDLDWASLCQISEAHKLGGVVYAQCGANIPEDAAREKLKRAFNGAIRHALTIRSDFELLSAALDRAAVPYIPIKAIRIAAQYPVPELRTMGDVDILIHAEDRDRVRACLEPLGFQVRKWAEDEWHYRRGASLFELQGHLMKRDEPGMGTVYNYFNGFWPHASASDSGGWQLDPSFHFFYLIAHIAKHLRWAGVGFRQFYDLAVLMRQGRTEYDWDWIRAEAERIGFFRFTACALALTERWFDVPSPYGTDCLSEALYETVTDKIFRDGVFGFDNRDNDIYALEQAQRRSSKSLRTLKLQTALHLAFPPYRDLIVSEKYAFLRGRPYLLPYAWVRRAARGRNSSNSRSLGAVLSVSERRLQKRSDLLSELGLEPVSLESSQD